MASGFLGLGSSFFMAESGSVAPVSLDRRYAIAHHILRSNDRGELATHIRQSLKTQLKMRTSFRWLL